MLKYSREYEAQADMLGAVIMAGGLRRLPDRVLEADEATDCPLEAGT